MVEKSKKIQNFKSYLNIKDRKDDISIKLYSCSMDRSDSVLIFDNTSEVKCWCQIQN